MKKIVSLMSAFALMLACIVTLVACGGTNAATPVVSILTGATTYAQNATATELTITASVTDSGTLSYQWYSNDTNDTRTPTEVGTNANSFTPLTTTVGTIYYYVVVTNTNNTVNGKKTATQTSNIVAVEVRIANELESFLMAIQNVKGNYTVDVDGSYSSAKIEVNGNVSSVLYSNAISKYFLISGNDTECYFSNDSSLLFKKTIWDGPHNALQDCSDLLDEISATDFTFDAVKNAWVVNDDVIYYQSGGYVEKLSGQIEIGEDETICTLTITVGNSRLSSYEFIITFGTATINKDNIKALHLECIDENTDGECDVCKMDMVLIDFLNKIVDIFGNFKASWIENFEGTDYNYFIEVNDNVSYYESAVNSDTIYEDYIYLHILNGDTIVYISSYYSDFNWELHHIIKDRELNITNHYVNKFAVFLMYHSWQKLSDGSYSLWYNGNDYEITFNLDGTVEIDMYNMIIEFGTATIDETDLPTIT